MFIFRTLVVCHKAWICYFVFGGLNVQGCFYTFLNFHSPFWKEKFINGLPTLFGQKVKETLASPLGVIDYDSLTYGDISSTIRNEGMKMCRDLKIQSQANKSKAKYEIGNFCTQYGLPSVIPKRKSKHRGEEPSEKSHRKKIASKYYRKQKFKTVMISIRKENPNP